MRVTVRSFTSCILDKVLGGEQEWGDTQGIWYFIIHLSGLGFVSPGCQVPPCQGDSKAVCVVRAVWGPGFRVWAAECRQSCHFPL